MCADRCAAAILLGVFATVPVMAADIFHSDGRYTQTASGMTFPRIVGDFRRGQIVWFLRNGTDESVEFYRATPMSEIAPTLNIYPATLGWTGHSNPAEADLCKWQFRRLKYGIMTVHPDAALVEEGAASLVQKSRTYSGYQAKYRLTITRFFNRGRVASREDVFMFCYAGGKWTVQYTFDYPVSYDAKAEIARFMHDLPLTIRDDSI